MFQKNSGPGVSQVVVAERSADESAEGGWARQALRSPLAGLKILKDGAYLLLRIEDGSGQALVCKIARANNERLRREVDRLAMLRAAHPLLGRRLPKVLESGTFRTGLFAGQAYYVMEHLPGRTLSAVLRAPERDGGRDRIPALVGHVGTTLVDMLDEHRVEPDGERLGQWYGRQLRDAIGALAAVPAVAPLLERRELVINGRPRRRLEDCLDSILGRTAVAALDAVPQRVCSLGHWNFHGENIILAPGTGGAPDFRVIDPDVKIAASDPVFGLARLLYTYPHDTMECRRYEIAVQGALADWPDCSAFDVNVTWPLETARSYETLFGGLTASRSFLPQRLDPRFGQDRIFALRLNLSLALCMLKGVALNQEPAFSLSEDTPGSLRNAGLFMFLQAVDFLNRVAEAGDD